MGSQFVDLNADGQIDYVTATFDGSPHVAYGSKKGFQKPVRLVDSDGHRIIAGHYWDYEKNSHEQVTRAMPDGLGKEQRCISALAYDWDADGDYDLLLGTYEGGALYRQMNEGTNKKPRFTGKNIAVHAGGKPLALPAKMTTPRLIDWDKDGDLDLIVGSFGDSYGEDQGGAVYLSLNEGSKGKPAFGTLEQLIAPSEKGGHAPTRPDAGLYADAFDYDGDGDLDLVVGGYSMWTPKSRELTDAEQARVKELEKQKAKTQAKLDQINEKKFAAIDKATEGLEEGSPEWMATATETLKPFSVEMRPINATLRKVTKELDELVPRSQRKAFVWLYEQH